MFFVKIQSWKVSIDDSILPENVRGRLRPDNRRLIHAAHRNRQPMVHTGRARHGRSRGVQRNARAVHAQRRRVPSSLLGDGQGELHEHTSLPHAHLARQGPRELPNDPRRQQGRSSPLATGYPRAGTRARQYVENSLY